MGPGGLGVLTPSWRKNMASRRIWLGGSGAPIAQPASAGRLGESLQSQAYRPTCRLREHVAQWAKSAILRHNGAALPSTWPIDQLTPLQPPRSGAGARGAARHLRGELCIPSRSEEHTSELQSLRHLVCRLLLE